MSIPRFDQLPLNKGDPPYSAWGLYGMKDQLGTLNRLTDDIVLKTAKQEIQTGYRISLNWPLDAQNKPGFNRQRFHKDIIQHTSRTGNDDVWTMNTQSSSQWDGLRHFAYQKEQKFYNGVTLGQIHDGSNVNGIHASVVPPTLGGVEASEDMLEWIWNNFSAVAGDQPSFECWPPSPDLVLHEVLLSGWGCPIGEIFDLEKLAAHCKENNRWSFFVSSEVCNVPGGVASPPNILAIF
ncbi:MAG: hypothetical protein Q9191_006528 [Dirinaria sp. TL-2023a]